MATTALKELLKLYKLTEDDCDQPVSDQDLETISRGSCEEWKCLCPHLELNIIIIKDIEKSPEDEHIKRYKFFLKWKKIWGSAATYKKLIAALLKIDQKQDAEEVCQVLKKSTENPPTPQTLKALNPQNPLLPLRQLTVSSPPPSPTGIATIQEACSLPLTPIDSVQHPHTSSQSSQAKESDKSCGLEGPTNDKNPETSKRISR